jgi:hypothetical protein
MTHEELVDFSQKLEKRVHALESENGKMKEVLNNLQTEMFLPSAMAQYPDGEIRKRTTMKGVLDNIINVINNKPKPKIIVQH